MKPSPRINLQKWICPQANAFATIFTPGTFLLPMSNTSKNSAVSENDILLVQNKPGAPPVEGGVDKLLADIKQTIAMADAAIDRQKRFNKAFLEAAGKLPENALHGPVPNTAEALRLMEMCTQMMERHLPEVASVAANRPRQASSRLINRV
jgi:hypothetical protein